MRKIVLLLCFWMAIFSVQSQFIDTKNTIPLKAGTKFYYAVRRCEGCYDLSATINAYSPSKELVWTWETYKGVIPKKGLIHISGESLRKADKISYQFSKGKITLTDEAIAFRVSDKTFNQISQSWAAEIEIADQMRLFPHIIKTKFPVTIEEQPVYLECYQIWADDGTMLWILDNANFPLILKMELGFEMELTTIE